MSALSTASSATLSSVRTERLPGELSPNSSEKKHPKLTAGITQLETEKTIQKDRSEELTEKKMHETKIQLQPVESESLLVPVWHLQVL